MPLTPGSAQLPLIPNKQWLYISDPYTDGLVTGPNAAALQESLFCYAYAQGYTGLIMYEMSQFISGGVLTNSSDWIAFINAAAAKGLEVGAAFGGPSVLNAVIAWNTSNTAKFKMVISEIEWWNYSSNLPFQEPGPTGTYSFFDSLQMFKNYKPQLNTANLELYTYNGFTKAYQDEYNSGFEILSSGFDYLTIRGNHTNTGPDSIVGGKMFEANQIIRVDNWPVQGNHTFYKLDATTPVTLVSGNTQLKVGQGKQYAGVGTSTTGTTLISSFTAFNYNKTIPAIFFASTTVMTIGGVSAPFGITGNTQIIISGGNKISPAGPLTTTTTATNSPTIVTIPTPTNSIITQKQASGGTTLITTSVPHFLIAGDVVVISSLGTGFDGTWTIVSAPTTTSFTINNGNPGLTVPTTANAGSYKIVQLAGSATYNLVPSATLTPYNIPNAEIRAEFEVTSIAPYTVDPTLGFTTVKLRGDKTFMFSPTSTVGSVNWFRSTAGVFKWSGGISGLKLIPGSGGLSGITPTYNAGTNETTFYIAGTFTGTAFDAGFLYGMVNFDVCYSAGGSYDNTPTYSYVSLGSELEQCSPYVNVFGLHNYVTNTPRYRTIDATRLIQLGQAGASPSNPSIKVTWIISAEPEYLQPFFIGDPGNGVPRKNPIDAYKYLAYPITPTPNPTQPPTYISAELNANVQNEVYIDGVTIFEDKDIRSVTTGNGPNIWVNAGPNDSLTANSGTYTLSGQYCDDCLPSTNYTYSWSVVSATPPGGGTVSPTVATPISGCINNSIPGTFTFSSAGVYTLRLTINDNSGAAPFAVGQNDMTLNITAVNTSPFTIDIAPDSIPTCAQSNDLGLTTDGSLTASITAAQGPIKPVTYNWTGPNGYTSSTIDNLASPTSSSVRTGLVAGTYQVTAVDSSFPPRSGTQTFVLNATYDVNANSNIFWTDPLCYGFSTGTVDLTFGPGFAPCGLGGPTISWSNGASGVSSLTSLSAGSYTASITDCVGCTGSKTAVITDPPPIIPTIVATDTTCGASNGSVTVTNIAGGTPPYTYLWSDFQTTQTAVNLAAGPYSVTVTDDNGCTGVSFPVTVLSSTGPTISLSGPSNVCCGQNATITASVTACAPYVITWSNGTIGSNSITLNFSGKPCDDKFGSISATVVDCNGCSTSAFFGFNITTPINPVTFIKILSGDPNNLTSCSGDAVTLAILDGDGSGSWNFGSPASTTNPLTVNQAWFNTYGTPGQPFTFVWSQVEAATGCTSQASLPVNYPIGVEVEVEVIPVICGGPIDGGGIDLTILASCGDPYTITWTGPVSGTDTTSNINYSITDLTDGTYDVTVEDAEGNIWNNPAVIVFTSVPEITNAVITNYCAGVPVSGNDGAINITVTGGTPPYTYVWTRTGDLGFLETTQDISNLSLGEYNVEVTDDNGCTTTETYVIEYSDPITINTSVVPPSCWGMCNGLAEIEISGGTAPYTLTVAGFPPVTVTAPVVPQIFSNLCATTYEINVVDVSGCSAIAEINVGNSVTVTQFTTRTVDPSSAETQDGAIYIDLISGGGGPPYDYMWTGPNGFTSTNQDITGLVAGDYEVTIKTVVSGVPQPTCAVTRKFKLQTSCVEFSLEELKVMLFKFQCCAGLLAKEYVQYQEIGRPDLAECKLIDLKYLTLAINTLSCINELPDACLSCEDISNILSQIKKICDCDCCDDAATGVYNVTYNPFTGQLDSN